MTIERDKVYMRLALQEARRGQGKTSPNPCVGAIIVKDDTVVGKGYHKKAGTPHAEIHALREAGKESIGSTMYVTLEPCNHTGKTPPCSHAVAAAGISRVVVGMEDPNPIVNGSGISFLRDHGIEVTTRLLEEECRSLNYPFLKFITTGLPWIVMKAGMSLDGKLNYQQGVSGWITGPESGKMVHRLRNTHDAILVGSNTVKIDNPSLTTRLQRGKGKDPVRIILDRTLSVAMDARPFIVSSTAQVWVFCSESAAEDRRAELERRGVKVLPVPCINDKLDLHQIFRCIGKHGLTSVLVEGGAGIHGAILKEGLYDYANLFIAPIIIGEGGIPLVTGFTSKSKANAVSLQKVKYTRMGSDLMVSGHVAYPAKTAR